MKRWILITISGILCVTLAAIVMLHFFRPSHDVANLVENTLDLAIVAGYKGFEGPEALRLDQSLEDLAKDHSNAADEASVILLAYSLGEHNAELEECAVTVRGPRVIPAIKKFRRSPPTPWKPRYLLLRLPKRSREFMYDSALDAIQHGKAQCE